MSLAMETRRWQSVQSACCAGVPKREECEVVLRKGRAPGRYSRRRYTGTQFRNCAAPVGRSAEPARALGTRRRCELCGRPAPVPGRAAPRASFSGVPRAARAAPEGGPGSPARPLRAPPRPALANALDHARLNGEHSPL